MRHLLVVMLLSSPLAPALAQVEIQIGLPSISIGINQPDYPQLVQLPGYPVYYDPNADTNYFFYDGMYWVYQGDNWYSSSWFNGPWALMTPEYVPLFILRVPVSYYRRPPEYFRGWGSDAPPRWGEHWGHDWEGRHGGWDRWNRNEAPAAAPLPVYQRQYSGSRYPRAEQQHALVTQHYQYQPRDAVVKQAYQAQTPRGAAPHPQQATHDEAVAKGKPPREAAPASRPPARAEPARAAPHEVQTTRRPPARAEPAPAAPHAEVQAASRPPARAEPSPTAHAARAEPAPAAPHAQPARAPEQGQETGHQGQGAPAASKRDSGQKRDSDQKRGAERGGEHEG
jgi:hypothetical protein